MAASKQDGFRIGSFNVQIFGETKAGKDDVMEYLAKIMRRYDIVLMQEIRNANRTALPALLRQINTQKPYYNFVSSDRLGRSSCKEQYAFLYKYQSDITLDGVYQYPDVTDRFEREPFSVKFSVPHTEIGEFVLMGIHVDPDVAEEEINQLVPAHKNVSQFWGTDNIAIMGDFNAGGKYITKKELQNLDLKTKKFKWLNIGDTNLAESYRPYDRVVVSGDAFRNSLVPGSGCAFRFDEIYGLDKEFAEDISDHYPVEFQLKLLDQDDARYLARKRESGRYRRRRARVTYGSPN